MLDLSLNLLIVEDDEDTCLNLRDILELDRYSVESVSTAAAAFAIQTLSEKDVILLDRRLPDGLAEQVLPRFRSAVPQADVIIITGHADMDSAIEALRLGATDYLLKPINPEALRASLRRLAERRRLANRLLQSERLAAIGQAMAGLTHESRNALSRSQANLRRLGRRIADRPDLLELIDAALAAQRDVEQLFEDVRQYAAPLRLRKERTDVRQLISDAWDQLTIDRKDRDAVLRYPDETVRPICEIDRFTMRNAIRNLLENSLAACQDRVEIDVGFEAAQLGEQRAWRISLRDNGPGFSPDQAERAFEPFVTTKTHGTGLGLAIVKRTVEEHGGHVDLVVPSKPGAEVVITLPRAIT